MKKFLLMLLIALSTVGVAYSAQDIFNSTQATIHIPVSGNTTVWSHSFIIDTGEFATISYCVSGVAPDVTIQLEASYQAPATEGVSDGEYGIHLLVAGTATADIVTHCTTSETWVHRSYLMPAMRFGRFKIIGINANGTDTTVQLKITQVSYR